MKQKAQVSAPIELLVGVIILAMVLVVGFYSYNNMCINQYNQKMKAALSTFAGEMATVYRGGTGAELPAALDFSSMGCGTGEITSVRIVEGTPKYCLKNVGADSCYALVGVGTMVINNMPRANMQFTQPLYIPQSVTISHTRQISTAVTELATALAQMADITDATKTSDYTGWDETSRGVWGPTRYSLVIKKKSKDEILLDETA